MEGFTPAEQAIQQAAPEPRASWFGDVRRILDIAELHPELPHPWIIIDRVRFRIPGYGPSVLRDFDAAEAVLSAALHVTFTPPAEPDDLGSYVIEAALPGGTALTVEAPAGAVAEERVTGQTVTDVVEWVRRVAEADEATAPAGTDVAA